MLKIQTVRQILHVFCGAILLQLSFSASVYAACGTTITWQADANTTVWTNTNNWNPRNVPDLNTETAFIRADWQIPTLPNANRTLSCLEINSGSMTAPAGSILTIVDDYFRNLNAGSLIVPGGSTFQVTMGGTSTQSFENVDTIPRLNINNSSTVNLTRAFIISDTFTITAGSGNVNIQGNLETQQTTAITIPASATVTVSTGVEWKVNGGLTVAGILRLMPGASLKIANGRTLSVSAGGTLQIAGASGNAAMIDSYNSSSTYTFNVIGNLDAEYFSINRMTAAGINVTGQILDLSNGVINYIPNAGYGLTLGAAATSLATMTGVGFYGQGAASPLNVNATAYVGSVLTFNNFSGIGGAANETDPGNRINWGSQAPTELLLTNNSPSGTPPATIAASSAYTHFATFAFALSATSTASDITSITFTIAGNNNSSDVAGVRVYRDDNNNCIYNAGTDAQVGGTYTVVGSPAKFTATFAANDIRVSNTASRCVHILLATSASAQTSNTIGIRIASTDDIINTQGYPLSATSGPPLSANTSTITGLATLRWAGGNSTAMNAANNWSPATVPSNTRDCQIGSGFNIPIMAATVSCLNTEFISGGTLNWNNTANIFQVFGAFDTSTGFTFQNTTATAILRFIGTASQSVNFSGQTFPGSVQVNNTTGPVIFESNATINGSMTLNGGITRIASGVTLTVNGGITVNNGATLDIEPGATLVLANGTTLTVALGGILELVGNTSSSSSIRATNNSSAYVVNISGTIRARYYSLRNLGLTGLTINAGATIDPTNQLQNGSYSYPGVNNAFFLRLLRQVPGNTLDAMTFDSGGSPVTGARSVSTNTTAGTLTISNHSGNMTGSSFSTAVNYLVSWGAAVNTLDLTQEAVAPASSNQGDVVNMGRFGFKQTSAGVFSNTDITFIRLTLTGTGSASDVNNVRLYYDSSCTGSGGSLIGTQTFSGNPARADFSSISGATVQADAVTPPKRCFYVTYSLSSTATNAATVGVEIQSAGHVTNSQGYAFNGSFSPPVSLGTTTIVGTTTYWTGATSTAWALAANWNGGLPTSTLNCVINDAANDPIISAGTQSCKSITIGTGTLTMTGGSLEVYGSFESTGTFTQGGFPLIIRDNGVTSTSQTVSSSSTLTGLQFNKTAGGSVVVGSATLTVSSLINMGAGSNFTFTVPSSKVLVASAGMTVTAGTLSVGSGGSVQIGSGQTLTLNGGTVATTGTNDVYPQSLSNKGTFTRQGGSGTWNFTATSGTVNLVGFVFEWLGTSGLNIGGTTNVTQINGGQLRSLPNSAGMRALQLNTTGSLPATISNFGWYWGSGNSVPSEATSYFLGFSSGCGNRTVSFDQWFGDFWPYTSTNTDAKISETNCNIVIDKASSPVSLTEFKATPYSGQVVLEWTTGLEWYHKGFNIYRSLSPSSGYTQINSELIRNDLFNANMHGSYAFLDQDVDNGTTYYYKLEDISTTEERTLHGPVVASPNLSLGVAPPPLASTIVSNNPSGSESSGGSGSSTSSPGQVQLEPNVTLLAKTQSSYRLKISIPNLQLSAHSLHPSYQRLSLPLYSRTVEAGQPELLQRTLMLKISEATSAQMSLVSEAFSTSSSVLIAPAPAWVVNAGSFVEQWTLNPAAYANTSYLPAQPLLLGTIVNDEGQFYLPIVISPVAYQASAQNLKKYNEIVVDIFLDNQNSWAPNKPISVNEAWGLPGTLKIGVAEDGLYELTYDQMVASGVIAPFDQANVNQLKMYFANQEHAIEINSNSGFFSSGDSIRFFAPHSETIESRLSYMLLVNDAFSPTPGLRMLSQNVSNYSGFGTNQNSFMTRIHLEENNTAVFNEPYDQDMDLFVWGLFYGIAGGSKVALTTDVVLPHLDSNKSVLVQALVKSRRTTAANYTNTLQLYVNDVPVASTSFSGSQVQIVNLPVDANYFVPGLNRITLEPTGAQLINGEYDMVYIDSIDISYYQNWIAHNDQSLIMNHQVDTDLVVDGFTNSQLLIYDLSLFGQAEKWTHASVGASSLGYAVQFNTSSNPQMGRRILVMTEDQLLTPTTLQLNYGSDLLNPANEADVLYVGSEELLDAIEPLAALREQQGYKTKLVLLDSIYSEFGQGLVTAESVRDFFVYAKTSWARKPQYFVLLGDGTYDPKAYQNTEMKNRFPVKLMKGMAFNYASDHWFVTEPEQIVPFAVVGRIPARSSQQMSEYVSKVLAYERGETKPNAAKMTALSDQPLYQGEDFAKFSDELVENIALWNPQMPVSQLNRLALGDSAFKTKINESFSQASLVHYMGHGAENMWADNSIFNNNDIDLLNNQKLPVVVAMNCLNASFYDPGSESFAEKLVMKKEGGAIAFWGSTSITPPSIQHVYQKAFYERLMTSSQPKLGDAVKISKLQAHQQSPFEEVMMSWTIIGDPMVKAVISEPTTTPNQAPTGGGSSGCSAFAGVGSRGAGIPWDLVMALFLESILSWLVIRQLFKRLKSS
jgi:hypothetical protein